MTETTSTERGFAEINGAQLYVEISGAGHPFPWRTRRLTFRPPDATLPTTEVSGRAGERVSG